MMCTGQDSDENLCVPKVVSPILGTVVGQVACGEHHTAVITGMFMGGGRRAADGECRGVDLGNDVRGCDVM